MANQTIYPTPLPAANVNKPAGDNYRNAAVSLVSRLRKLVGSVHSLHYNVSGQPAPSEQQAQAPAGQPAPPSPPGGEAPISESLLTAHGIVSRLEDDLQSLVGKV